MSVPSLASNRINPAFNQLDALETELDDLSAFTHTLSGAISMIILNDLSDELFELSGRVNDLSGYVYSNLQPEVTDLSTYVYNLPVIPDLTTEVADISNRLNDLSGYVYSSLQPEVTDLSTYVYNLPVIPDLTTEVADISNRLNDLSGYVYSSLQPEVTDLSTYVYNLPAPTTPTIQQVLTAGNDASNTGITNLGNTGIGKSPSFPLDVSGNSIFNGKVGIGTTTLDNDLTIQGILQWTNYNIFGTQKYGMYSFDNKLQLNPRTSTGAFNNINAFTMDNTGRIAFGSAFPSNTFDVLGLTTGRSGTHPSTYVALFTGNIGTDNGFGVGTFNGNNRVQIGFNRIRGDGSVANGDLLITSKGSGGGVGLWPNEVQVVTALGTGTLRFPQLTTNGTLITSGGDGTVSVSSDRRVKKNIEYPDDINGLEIVNNLKPAKYHYIYEEDTERKTLGFIAQDVDEAGGIDAVDGRKHQYHFKLKMKTDISHTPIYDASGEIVTDDEGNPIYDNTTYDKPSPSSPGEIETDEDGNPIYDYDRPRYMGLSDRALIVYLVSAVQELSKEIEILKSKLP